MCRNYVTRYKFLAMDREKGAEWLRGLLQKFGPIVKASCHQIVNYKGMYRIS